MLRSIQRWSDQSESMLQDCFGHADWDMFRVGSGINIDIYTRTVTEFIRKCIGDGSIRTKPKARSTSFNHGKVTGNMAEYKQSSYSLRKAINQAKRQYGDKVESQFIGSDMRRV